MGNRDKLRCVIKSRKLLLFAMLYSCAVVWYIATSLSTQINLPSTTRPVIEHVVARQKKSTSFQPSISLQKYNASTITNKDNLCNMDLYIQNNNDMCRSMLAQLKSGSTNNSGQRYMPTMRVNTKSKYVVADQQKPRIYSLKQTVDTRFMLKSSDAQEGCDLRTVSQNCDIARLSYMYGKHDVTEEEREFPLAFTVKLHNNGNQAHRLLRYIYRLHNVYCIHVDKKASDDLYKQFLDLSACFDNIIVIKDRVSVIYSSIRQVEAEMRCMYSTVYSNISWKYYINLAGQEFMLKTNIQIVRILKVLNGSNDIESYPNVNDKDRLLTKSFLTGRRIIRSKHKKEPFYRNITMRKGSAYGMFSREFVEYVLNSELVGDFLGWLNDTYAPEETIWATLNALQETPGGCHGNVTHDDGTFLSRAVIWKGSDTEICHGNYIRRVCVYGVGDIPWLLAHKNVVANKFYEYTEPEALDCIENMMYGALLGDTSALSDLDIDYYKRIIQKRYHHVKIVQ